jgi:hypothetical protein
MPEVRKSEKLHRLNQAVKPTDAHHAPAATAATGTNVPLPQKPVPPEIAAARAAAAKT